MMAAFEDRRRDPGFEKPMFNLEGQIEFVLLVRFHLQIIRIEKCCMAWRTSENGDEHARRHIDGPNQRVGSVHPGSVAIGSMVGIPRLLHLSLLLRPPKLRVTESRVLLCPIIRRRRCIYGDLTKWKDCVVAHLLTRIFLLVVSQKNMHRHQDKLPTLPSLSLASPRRTVKVRYGLQQFEHSSLPT